MAEAARQQELAPVKQQAGSGSSASTSLEVAGKGIYRDLPALLEAFDRLRDRFNVCFPVMKPDVIPPMYAIALRPVSIDARFREDGEPMSSDIYRDHRDKRKYGLTKIGLDKIAAAAGISWHPGYTGRVDDRSDPRYREYRACAVVQNLDGTSRLITQHKTLDLRDGADHGMTDKQLAQARQHIDALCESKAMNRCVRKYAFIKGLYEKHELAGRPFVVAALVFTGETSDPDLKREVARVLADRARGANAALFGPAPGGGHVIEDLGQRHSPPALGATPRDPDDDEGDDDQGDAAVSETRRLIATIADISSRTMKGGSGATHEHFTIKTADGDEFYTLSKEHGGVAKDAFETDRAVAIEARPGEFGGLEIVSIAAVDARG